MLDCKHYITRPILPILSVQVCQFMHNSLESHFIAELLLPLQKSHHILLKNLFSFNCRKFGVVVTVPQQNEIHENYA